MEHEKVGQTFLPMRVNAGTRTRTMGRILRPNVRVHTEQPVAPRLAD